MSFTEPLSVNATGSVQSLPRTSVEGDQAIYSSSDGNVVITADHTVAKRIRRVLRLDLRKLSPDPHKPSENVAVTMSTYIVFDLPIDGYTNAEALVAYKGLTALMAASSDAITVKLLGGES